MQGDLLDDYGSDLSSDYESRGSKTPLTPGTAQTPRTSPQHKSQVLSSMDTLSSDKKVSGKKTKERKKFITGQGKGQKEASGKKKIDLTGMKKSNDSRNFNKKPVDGPSEAGPSSAKQSSMSKPKSMKGWAYVVDHELRPDEEPIEDSKRTRRARQQSYAQNTRSTASKDASSFDRESSSSTPAPTVTETASKRSRPRISLKLNVDGKTHSARASTLPTQDSKDEAEGRVTTTSRQLQSDEEDNVEAMQQPSRKRKREKKSILAENEGDASEDEDHIKGVRRAVTSNSEGRQTARVGHNKKKKSEVEEKKHDVESSADDYQDEDMSEDEVISNASDEDFAAESAAKSKATGTSVPMSIPNRIKRTAEGGQESAKKSEPRQSTGSSSGKTTVQGLINQFQKPATASANSMASQPAPKVAVRKVSSMNLFDNLMGFGNAREGTPTKSGANKGRVSGAGGGLKTPQGTSPLVRPSGSQPKREANPSGITTATPTRTPSMTARASPMVNSARGRPVTVDLRGANGEHVTAEEMAKKREEELHANAHPKDLFDLLEGGEIMMQFEEETRQLLAYDALMARHKLYKAGRTEGYPFLVERIRESHR